jgi:hypothetical protein
MRLSRSRRQLAELPAGKGAPPSRRKELLWDLLGLVHAGGGWFVSFSSVLVLGFGVFVPVVLFVSFAVATTVSSSLRL